MSVSASGCSPSGRSGTDRRRGVGGDRGGAVGTHGRAHRGAATGRGRGCCPRRPGTWSCASRSCARVVLPVPVGAPPAHRPGPVRRDHGAYLQGCPRARSTTWSRRWVLTPASRSPRWSRICADLDAEVSAFRTGPWPGRPTRTCSSTRPTARPGGPPGGLPGRGGRRRVSADGRREVLGMDVGDSEDRAFWTAFLRSLRARGLGGGAAGGLRRPRRPQAGDRGGADRLVVAALPGALHAQRARSGAQGKRGDGRRGDPHRVRPARRRSRGRPVRRHRRGCSAAAAQGRGDDGRGQEDLLAFTAFPQTHWRQLWSTNPLERVNKEIKRRTDVVGVFPNPQPCCAWQGPSSSSSTTNGQPRTGATSERSMALIAAEAPRRPGAGEHNTTDFGMMRKPTRERERKTTTQRDVTRHGLGGEPGTTVQRGHRRQNHLHRPAPQTGHLTVPRRRTGGRAGPVGAHCPDRAPWCGLRPRTRPASRGRP